MKFQSRFKSSVATALIVGTLVMPMRGMAADSKVISGWGQIIGGAAGAAMSWIMTDFFYEQFANVDAAQLALEGLVYAAMLDVTDKWDPEPKESYQKAAQNNEDNASVDMSGVTNEKEADLSFETEVLTNVGIEALNVLEVSDIAGARDKAVEKLTRLTYDGDTLVLNTELTQQEDGAIEEMQTKNYQWISTAGIARAELGLETAYQAAVDAGGAAADSGITGDSSNDDNIQMAAATAGTANLTLKQLPNSVTSTGMAQRVQTLMNLELAQRVNLSNALQGNVLSIEAARALKNSPRVIK